MNKKFVYQVGNNKKVKKKLQLVQLQPYQNSVSVLDGVDNLTFMRPCIVIISIIIPTRSTNFSNLLLKWNSTCFGQFFCSSSGVFSMYTQQWYMSYRFADSLQTCMTYTIAVCTLKKTPDDGQRNCPKHVEFHSKNKFEKLVHLVGYIIENRNGVGSQRHAPAHLHPV